VLAAGVLLLALSAAIGPATSLRHSLMRQAIIDDSLWIDAAQNLVGFFFTDYGYRVSALAVWALAGLAISRVALTFYLAHIAALGMWTRLTGLSDDKWSILLALSVGSLAAAWLIRLRWRRGPAEWLTARVSRFRLGRTSLPA
jgi:hypothetical protein